MRYGTCFRNGDQLSKPINLKGSLSLSSFRIASASSGEDGIFCSLEMRWELGVNQLVTIFQRKTFWIRHDSVICCFFPIQCYSEEKLSDEYLGKVGRFCSRTSSISKNKDQLAQEKQLKKEPSDWPAHTAASTPSYRDSSSHRQLRQLRRQLPR